MSEYKAQGWRIAGYYPGQYAKSMSALGIGIDYSDDDHDRYEAEFMADLAAYAAKVKADMLDGLLVVIENEWTDVEAIKAGLKVLAEASRNEAKA